MSRPLLYMHLDKLEKAGLIAGHLELPDDGRALKRRERQLTGAQALTARVQAVSYLRAGHEVSKETGQTGR
jgi:DNA-binding PadR family transcriptional regulator